LVVLALVSGCGSGSSTAGGSSAGGSSGGAPDAKAAPPALSRSAPDKSTSGGNGSGGPAARIVPDRALIRTADLSVTVEKVAEQAGRATQIALAAGGEVYSDQRNNGATPDQSTADITLKVPPTSLDGVLDQLDRLGQEESRHTSTEDVTEQVADVESRVSSARASLARLRALYGRAGTIAEITSLETEVSQREADLESLQARQRALAQQTADATITLHLHGKAAAVAAAAAAPSGFWSGLKRGWHTFAISAGWLFTALGAALPFLVLGGLVGYGVWWVRRRRPPAPAATPIPAMPPIDGA
jgi:hypothetical protein